MKNVLTKLAKMFFVINIDEWDFGNKTEGSEKYIEWRERGFPSVHERNIRAKMIWSVVRKLLRKVGIFKQTTCWSLVFNPFCQSKHPYRIFTT